MASGHASSTPTTLFKPPHSGSNPPAIRALVDSGLVPYVPRSDGLRQARVGPGAQLELGWRAPGAVSGSPVVGGHTVYTLDPDGGTLYALDATGERCGTSAPVGQTSRFATPTLAEGWCWSAPLPAWSRYRRGRSPRSSHGARAVSLIGARGWALRAGAAAARARGRAPRAAAA
jgi:PQQ-like domain